MNKTKVVVITGSSSGIGEATEKLLSKNSYQVIGLSRSFKKSTNNANLTKNVIHFGCDITKINEVKQTFSLIKKKFNKIDILINNAGSGTVASIEDIDPNDLLDEININLIAHLYCIKEAIPLLRKNKGGLILNVISTGGRVTFPSIALYDACKHAMESVARSLSWELEKWNIKVSILEPGAIKTNFGKRMKRSNNSKYYADYYEKASRGFVKMYKNSQKPEEVSQLVLKMLEKYTWRKNTSFIDRIWIWSYILLPKTAFDLIVKKYFN